MRSGELSPHVRTKSRFVVMWGRENALLAAHKSNQKPARYSVNLKRSLKPLPSRHVK